jgi:hypothetical protein
MATISVFLWRRVGGTPVPHVMLADEERHV